MATGDWLNKLRGWLTGQPKRQARPASAQDALPPRPQGPLIWVHDSDGRNRAQIDALAELIEELGAPFTLIWTGQEGAQPELARFAPCLRRDSHRNANGFLDHWQPDLAMVFGGELPATLLLEANKRGVPLYLLQSGDAPTPARGVLRRFKRIFATDHTAMDKLELFGAVADQLTLIDPLYDGSVPPPGNEAERSAMAQHLAGRPTWLAASTNAEEDPIAVAAHAQAARRAHRLLLILHPSDPERGAELVQSLRREGWRVAQRSQNEKPSEDTQIYVADLPDELGLWFRVSPVSLMGGSLDSRALGGIDPLHAAALGSAILHGPYLGRHEQSYQTLDAAGAARNVRDADSLSRVLNILSAPEKAAELAHNAWLVSSSGAEASGFVAQQIVDDLQLRGAT